MAGAGAVEDLEISPASEDVSFSVGDSFESFDALQIKVALKCVGVSVRIG